MASNNFNDENMVARIGELAHEKQVSITAEDWEGVHQGVEYLLKVAWMATIMMIRLIYLMT
jgi:hypothetical protein